jgi:osmoprotectant transport system ATP-binding protein
MIEYLNVSKTFADGTPAVAQFSLVLPSHTTTVFVGSSGCGKTTLLRMVNRMVDPSGGQVLIDDVDVATRNPVELRRSIGYVMQHAGLLPHRRVVDNVAVPLRLAGVSRAEATGRALEALEKVGLDGALAPSLPAPALRWPAAARRASRAVWSPTPTSC